MTKRGVQRPRFVAWGSRAAVTRTKRPSKDEEYMVLYVVGGGRKEKENDESSC